MQQRPNPETGVQGPEQKEFNLAQAVNDKDIDTVKLLLTKGIINGVDSKYGYSGLCWAICYTPREESLNSHAMLDLFLEHDNTAKLLEIHPLETIQEAVYLDLGRFKKLIARYEQAKIPVDYNQILLYAVKNERIEVAGWLLKFKENVSADLQYSDGDYCLHYAVRCKNKQMLLLLQQHGANVHLKNKIEGVTPIRLAARHEFFEGAFLMLHSVVNIAEKDRKEYESVLLRAVRKQAPEKRNPELDSIIQRLLKLKVPLTGFLYDNQDAPLHAAVRNHDIQTLEWLLNSDPDLKVVLALENADGKTAVRLAASFGYFDCVNKILEKTGPMDAKEAEKHETVLVRAIKSQDIVKRNSDIDAVIRKLLAQNVRLQVSLSSDIRGDISFHAAIRNGDMETVNLLLGSSHNVPQILALRNKEGLTPIQLAAKLGHWDIFKMICEGKTSDFFKYPDDESLSHAIEAGRVDIVNLLIEKKFMLHPKYLFLAVARCNEKMITALLHAGLKATLVDVNGFTPFQYAEYLDKHHAKNVSSVKKYADCFNRAYAAYKQDKEEKASPEDKEFKTAARKFLNLFQQKGKTLKIFPMYSDNTGEFVKKLTQILADADSTAETIRATVQPYLDAQKDIKSHALDLLQDSGLKDLVQPEKRVVLHPRGLLN